ncbi:somatostatin receptor type 5-like [Stylophora pistillata]|uniref:somatostatin receptor type 5-like n=1 Tax=Stylophora pistillata TaxID=50429 RepID=UPI000C049E13|nr:somatostatin receptor type 5-like [Stylophora pistillata]
MRLNKSVEDCYIHLENFSSTDFGQQTGAMKKSNAILWCSLFILEAFLIIVANLLTTFVFLGKRKLRRGRYYLMINLTISDTLVGALAIPMFVLLFGDSQQLWSSRINLFDTALFFDMFAGFASITFLAMIALERLYATLRPFNYRALKSGCYILFVVTAWIAAIFIPLFHVMVLKYPKVFRSRSRQATLLFMWIPFFSTLLLVICISYLVILRKVRDVQKNDQHRILEKESSLSRICLLVTAVSLAAWLPFVIANLVISTMRINPSVSRIQLFYVTKFLHFANSLLNPVLYVLKIPEFKEGLLAALCLKKSAGSTRELSVRSSRISRVNNPWPVTISPRPPPLV